MSSAFDLTVAWATHSHNYFPKLVDLIMLLVVRHSSHYAKFPYVRVMCNIMLFVPILKLLSLSNRQMKPATNNN